MEKLVSLSTTMEPISGPHRCKETCWNLNPGPCCSSHPELRVSYFDSLLVFIQFTPLSSTLPTQDVEFLNLKSLCGDFKFDFHFNFFFFLHYCLCSKKLLCLWCPFTQIAMLGQALFRCKKSQVVGPEGMCNPGLYDSLLFQSMLPLASLAFCQPISTPAC